MSDLQAAADRVEIEALRGEFTDAVMMSDHGRLASLFTPDGVMRIPLGSIEAAGREQIRALGQRRQALADYFVQTTHPGAIQLDGDTAAGRAYLSELVRLRDGSSALNCFVYHDRCQRTGDGWKFTERVAEFRYPGHHAADRLGASRSGRCPLTRRPAPPALHDRPHHDQLREGTMTIPVPATAFTGPAPAQRLGRAAAALTEHGFTVEIPDDAGAARTRIKDLIPEGASVLTAASETLRLSGIRDDINASGRYEGIGPRAMAMDRATQAGEIRRLYAIPDVVVGSVAAVTETGSLVAAPATGSQLPAYSGGAARRTWIAGAQKVVPGLPAALRRAEDHCLPLETARSQQACGQPSAINHLLILNAEPCPGRSTVLLLRRAIGF